MQLVFQALQAPRGLQQVLSQDLLLLSGVCGHGDGVPDLNQNGLTEGGRENRLDQARLRSSTRFRPRPTAVYHPFNPH